MNFNQLATELLAFYDHHGRSLPWRGESDLYRIWVSEVMLQQTGVSVVIPYYLRFIEQFPTVAALAHAPLDSVLAVWQGLGYYRRARHLHAAALQIMAQWGGVIPTQRPALETLPGIGRSTAAAILAIGLGRREAILDGNVKRVLARFLALETPVESLESRRLLWSVAEQLTPEERPGDYAQAIMDLGATLCTLRAPSCAACPWRRHCQALASGSVEHWPKTTQRAPKPAMAQFCAVVQRAEDGALLLQQRPGTGLLAGLWEPPGGPYTPSALFAPPATDFLLHWLRQHQGLYCALALPLPLVRHTFTHLTLTVYPFYCPHSAATRDASHHAGLIWTTPAALATRPIATLHRKILALIPVTT